MGNTASFGHKEFLVVGLLAVLAAACLATLFFM